MTSKRSAALPRESVMALAGVSGEIARPASMLWEWTSSMTFSGSSVFNMLSMSQMSGETVHTKRIYKDVPVAS